MKGDEKIKRAEVVEVVRVLVAEGEGTDSSPVELVEQYWGKDGHYIGKIKSSQLRGIIIDLSTHDI